MTDRGNRIHLFQALFLSRKRLIRNVAGTNNRHPACIVNSRSRERRECELLLIRTKLPFAGGIQVEMVTAQFISAHKEIELEVGL